VTEVMTLTKIIC